MTAAAAHHQAATVHHRSFFLGSVWGRETLEFRCLAPSAVSCALKAIVGHSDWLRLPG